MDKGQIILDELNAWIYNDENQAGDKLQIIDASDVPTIIENLVKKLTIVDIVEDVNHVLQKDYCEYCKKSPCERKGVDIYDEDEE